jgi:hypothetical protein
VEGQDYINERRISITGWAVDDEAEDAGEGVRVDVYGKSYPADRCPGPDVAARLNKPAYENAGLTFNIFVSSQSAGSHHLTLKALLLASNHEKDPRTNEQHADYPAEVNRLVK